jgi:hypothetical protein
MRLAKLFLIVILTSTLQWGWAQVEQDEAYASNNPIKSVHIYPNPASEFIFVKIDKLPVEKVRLTLHSIIGNQMEIETEIVDDVEHEGKVIRVRVKDLAAGYYLLAVKDDDSKFRGTFKFLKR